MKRYAALCTGLLVVGNAYAEAELATVTATGFQYGRSCAVTFEQKGTAYGVPRWYAAIDRNPTDPSFARGNFAALLIYTAAAVDANGSKHEEFGWETFVGIRDRVRVDLGFDHVRRDGRRRLRVKGV